MQSRLERSRTDLERESQELRRELELRLGAENIKATLQPKWPTVSYVLECSASYALVACIVGLTVLVAVLLINFPLLVCGFAAGLAVAALARRSRWKGLLHRRLGHPGLRAFAWFGQLQNTLVHR